MLSSHSAEVVSVADLLHPPLAVESGADPLHPSVAVWGADPRYREEWPRVPGDLLHFPPPNCSSPADPPATPTQATTTAVSWHTLFSSIRIPSPSQTSPT